jgi:hypothetical protein
MEGRLRKWWWSRRRSRPSRWWRRLCLLIRKWVLWLGVKGAHRVSRGCRRWRHQALDKLQRRFTKGKVVQLKGPTIFRISSSWSNLNHSKDGVCSPWVTTNSSAILLAKIIKSKRKILNRLEPCNETSRFLIKAWKKIELFWTTLQDIIQLCRCNKLIWSFRIIILQVKWHPLIKIG